MASWYVKRLEVQAKFVGLPDRTEGNPRLSDFSNLFELRLGI